MNTLTTPTPTPETTNPYETENERYDELYTSGGAAVQAGRLVITQEQYEALSADGDIQLSRYLEESEITPETYLVQDEAMRSRLSAAFQRLFPTIEKWDKETKHWGTKTKKSAEGVVDYDSERAVIDLHIHGNVPNEWGKRDVYMTSDGSMVGYTKGWMSRSSSSASPEGLTILGEEVLNWGQGEKDVYPLDDPNIFTRIMANRLTQIGDGPHHSVPAQPLTMTETLELVTMLEKAPVYHFQIPRIHHHQA